MRSVKASREVLIFRNPERNISSASFGQITRTRGGPRVIQLGLKLRF
jgi:hypothetical protein